MKTTKNETQNVIANAFKDLTHIRYNYNPLPPPP